MLTAIPFYLIPVPTLGFPLYDALKDLSGINKEEFYGPVDKTFFIAYQNEKVLLSPAQQTIEIWNYINIIIFILLIVYRFWGYGYLKYRQRQYSETPLSQEETELFCAVKQVLQIRSRVRLIKTASAAAPFTTGILFPAIIIPDNPETDTKHLSKILAHELCHVKHRDILWNSLGMIIISLHWYNPFCYLYLHALRSVNELYSDETATSTMNIKEKLDYCNLIIAMSQNAQSGRNCDYPLQPGFTYNAKKQTKRRIDSVMKKKKRAVIIPFFFGIVCIISGTFTTFAYKEPRVIIDPGETWTLEADDDFVPECPELEEDLIYEDSFVAENGQVYPVIQENERKSCAHSWENGERKLHTKSGKGCKIDYFRCKRCTKCGVTKGSNTPYSTLTFKICPH